MPKDARLTSHVSPEVKEKVNQVADEMGLSESSYISMLVHRDLREKGRLPGVEGDTGNRATAD